MRASQGHKLSDVYAFNAACVSVSVSANRDDGEMQETGKQVSAFRNKIIKHLNQIWGVRSVLGFISDHFIYYIGC